MSTSYKPVEICSNIRESLTESVRFPVGFGFLKAGTVISINKTNGVGTYYHPSDNDSELYGILVEDFEGSSEHEKEAIVYVKGLFYKQSLHYASSVSDTSLKLVLREKGLYLTDMIESTTDLGTEAVHPNQVDINAAPVVP